MLEKRVYYTKIWPNGEKMIFQFYRFELNQHDDGNARVFMRCDGEGFEYFEDDVCYVGFEGTSEGAILRRATKEEIAILLSPQIDN